jgi:hypothetical protein
LEFHHGLIGNIFPEFTNECTMMNRKSWRTKYCTIELDYKTFQKMTNSYSKQRQL